MSLLRFDFSKLDKRIYKLTDRQVVELRAFYLSARKDVTERLAFIYSNHGGSFSEMMKYNRLDRLDKELALIINELNTKSGKHLKLMQRTAYQQGYYTSGFMIEKSFGFDLGFGKLDAKTVDKAVLNSMDRVGFINRNKAHTEQLRRKLSTDIASGLARGASYQEIGRDINASFKTGSFNAERIARTEAHRAQLMARIDAFEHLEEKGVEAKKRWRSTLDDKTRDNHQDLDGKEVGLSDDFESGSGGRGPGPGQMGTAEDDIHCRCGLDFITGDMSPKFRRARDSATGRGEIIEYKTYNEWAGAKAV